MRYFLLLTGLSALLMACDGPASEQLPDVYVDTKTFIDGQITLLNRQKPMVQKTVLLDTRDQVQQTDSIDWNRELELFRQIDINKPAFRSSYTTARPDSLTYDYTVKSTEDRLAVRTLTVQLDSASRQPARITAVLQSQNPLYKSERRVLLECGPTKTRQWRVAHYRVEGFRELTFFGRNTFQIEGRIR
jgi:hypothetical protein